MGLFLLSILLFLVTSTAYYGAGNLTHLSVNIPMAFGGLTAVCLFVFILSLAVAVIGSTDRKGGLRAPDSLGALLTWMLLIPHAGLLIGLLVNNQSTIEIMQAVRNSTGTAVRLVGDGVALLDGEIGYGTLESLSEEHRKNVISLLELRSEGGDIDSAIEMGAFLRLNDIATFVERRCESACVIVALSSTKLYVTLDAQFGFHRGSAIASYESQLGKYIAKLATTNLIAQLKNLGVPEQILRRAEQTPPMKMYYVSGAEFLRAGLAQTK